MYRSLLPTPPLKDHLVPLRKSTEDNRSIGISPPSTLRSDSSMPQLSTPVKKPIKTIMDYTPRFSKFLADSTTTQTPFVHKHDIVPAEETAMRLRETQRRFSQGVPLGGDGNCAGIDRQLVLGIYNEALSILSKLPDKHTQIAAECARKTRVILGIISADPDDTVFTLAGQLLKPLEPQYANPRLDTGMDEFGVLAQWRLNAWRKEGWPEQYPAGAVKKETRRGDSLVDHEGNQSMKDGKMLEVVYNDEEMWDENGLDSREENAEGNRKSKMTAQVKGRRGEAATQMKGKRREATSASSSSRRRGRSGHVIMDSEDEDWTKEPGDDVDRTMESVDEDDWS